MDPALMPILIAMGVAVVIALFCLVGLAIRKGYGQNSDHGPERR